MARDHLREAREDADMTQGDLARKIGAERRAVAAWEAGRRSPQAHYRRQIRKILNNQEKDLFKNFDETDETQEPLSCATQSTSDTLVSSDSPIIPESEEETPNMDTLRRKITGTFATGAIATGSIALVNTIQVITGPAIEPDAYLDSIKDSIPTWWTLLNTGNYSKLEAKLNKHIPVLKKIAISNSAFQKQAASLAIEAKIMQVLLANHNLQFSERESHCLEAMQMGTLSGDKNLLALTQFWLADTHSYCFHRPQPAIDHLNDALSNVDENELLRSAIYSNLSIAHAQKRDETDALDFMEMAHSLMPRYPELDPLYESVGIGPSELDQYEGKTLLYLAEHLNSNSYAQRAYDAFNKSTSKQAISKGYRIQALVRKADAARVLGEKDECVTCLTDGYTLGAEMGNTQKLTQIQDVLRRVPESWQRKTAIKNLQKDVSQALVVARR